MIRVLFTGGGGAGNESIHRLLSDRYETFFADADPAAISPDIPADRHYRIACADDPGFTDSVVRLCRTLGIDLVVPGVDEELPHMPAVAAACPDTRVLVPSPDYVALMSDKLASAETLHRIGIDVPWTRPIDEAADATFPCVAKPRRGRGSRGFQIVDSSAECDAVATLAGNTGYVLQEWLHGTEYTVVMAADSEANLKAVVPIRIEIKRGITIRAQTECSDAVTNACRAIHEAQPTPACYNIQLVLDERGRARPFEINPRVSTTFCLGLAAGVDPIAIYWDPPAPAGALAKFRPGLGLSRHWRNTICAVDPR